MHAIHMLSLNNGNKLSGNLLEWGKLLILIFGQKNTLATTVYPAGTATRLSQYKQPAFYTLRRIHARNKPKPLRNKLGYVFRRTHGHSLLKRASLRWSISLSSDPLS